MWLRKQFCISFNNLIGVWQNFLRRIESEVMKNFFCVLQILYCFKNFIGVLVFDQIILIRIKGEVVEN